MTGNPTIVPPEQPEERARLWLFTTHMTRRTLLPPVLSLSLMLIWLLIYFLGPRNADGNMHPATLLLAGAKINDLIAAGQIWRLLTAIFLHVDSTHLFINAIGIFFLAQICENLLDTASTFIIFIAGGVAGFALSFALGAGPSLGSSGASYALLGALLAFTVRHRKNLPENFRKIFLLAIAIWLAVTVGYSSKNSNVDHAAHAGGMITGFLLGLLTGKNPQCLSIVTVKPAAWLKPCAYLAVIASTICLSTGGASLARAFDMPDPGRTTIKWADAAVTIPASWKHGRMWGSECRLDAGTPVQHIVNTGTLCLKDPWGSILILGKGRQLAPGVNIDLSMSIKRGFKTPVSQTENNITQQLIPVDSENTIAFLSYDILAEMYQPMLESVIKSIKFN